MARHKYPYEAISAQALAASVARTTKASLHLEETNQGFVATFYPKAGASRSVVLPTSDPVRAMRAVERVASGGRPLRWEEMGPHFIMRDWRPVEAPANPVPVLV